MGILQILGLIVITAVFLISYSRSKIMDLVARSLPVLLVFFGIMAFVGLFLSQPFDYLSDKTLKSAKVYEVLVGIDDAVPLAEWAELSSDVWDDVQDFFRITNDNSGSEGTVTEGLLEDNLYPVLVDLIGLIYRVFATILSVVAMFSITYFQYTTPEIGRMKKLEARVKELES